MSCSSLLTLWQVQTGSFSRIAHDETNYLVVYFKARLTETYEIWIEQGYTNSRSIHHHNSCCGKQTYKTMISTPNTSNIIYADEQHQIFYSSIHHLASSCISSIVPLSPRQISPSVSLVDSEWRNLRDCTMLESILSSKGQFASSKLSINRDTWVTHKSVVIIKIQGRRILAYNEGINEVLRANNQGQ